MDNRKKGFTLVELLAVIVILAVILVIAVPQITGVIEETKKGIFTNSAITILNAAEKRYEENKVLELEKEIICNDLVSLSEIDYKTCEIEFVEDIPYITLVGMGKFEGMNICGKSIDNIEISSTCSIDITYDCNGGEGSTTSNTFNGEDNFKLSKSGCYKITPGASGMVQYVKGWSTDSNATDPLYDAEASITEFNSTNDTITLYAVYDNLFNITGNYTVIDDKIVSDSSTYGNWKVRILGSEGNTSGTANIIFNTTTNIDAFLVGGGASGCDQSCKRASAPGGGGGSTLTFSTEALENQENEIIIGAPGSGIGAYCSADNFGYATGRVGNPTTAFGKTAAGGVSPRSITNDNQEFGESNGIWYAGNGGDAWDYYGGGFNNWNNSAGGHGGGAGSRGYDKYNGTPNTGGGGGAGVYNGSGSGGSGIAVIRNTRI